jgi:hypothetical protein
MNPMDAPSPIAVIACIAFAKFALYAVAVIGAWRATEEWRME